MRRACLHTCRGEHDKPQVLESIEELRNNMNSHSPEDPDQFTRSPDGEVELLAVDQMLWYLRRPWHGIRLHSSRLVGILTQEMGDWL